MSLHDICNAIVDVFTEGQSLTFNKTTTKPYGQWIHQAESSEHLVLVCSCLLTSKQWKAGFGRWNGRMSCSVNIDDEIDLDVIEISMKGFACD